MKLRCFAGNMSLGGLGGHYLPFSAICCRFSPSIQSVWLLQRVGITFALMGM
jgi:hypothetical protein